MRKLTSALLITALALSLAACAEDINTDPSRQQLEDPVASVRSENPRTAPTTPQTTTPSEPPQTTLPAEQPVPRLAEPLEGIAFDSRAMPREHEFAWEMFMLTSTYDTALIGATVDAIDWHIRREFFDIVSTEESSAWSESFRGFWDNPISSLMEYNNLFSFIVNFDLPVDRVRKIMNDTRLERIESGSQTQHDEWGWRNFTEEDIEVILTLDEAKVLERFATEYVIVHNGRGFSPSWIYWHTPEDYAKVGITPEMIAERLPLYAEFNFSDEADVAFSAKLSEFVGEEVSLSAMRAASTTTIRLT